MKWEKNMDLFGDLIFIFMAAKSRWHIGSHRASLNYRPKIEIAGNNRQMDFLL